VFRRIGGRWLVVHHHAEACRDDRRAREHVGAGLTSGTDGRDG
jgi:hypothetical protein